MYRYSTAQLPLYTLFYKKIIWRRTALITKNSLFGKTTNTNFTDYITLPIVYYTKSTCRTTLIIIYVTQLFLYVMINGLGEIFSDHVRTWLSRKRLFGWSGNLRNCKTTGKGYLLHRTAQRDSQIVNTKILIKNAINMMKLNDYLRFFNVFR